MKTTIVVLGARNLPLDKQSPCYCKIKYGGKSYKTLPTTMHSTVQNVWVWNQTIHLKPKPDSTLVLTVWRSSKGLTTRNDAFMGKLEFESLPASSTDTDQWYQLSEDAVLAASKGGVSPTVRGSVLLRIGPFVTEDLKEAYAKFIDSTITGIMKNYDPKNRNQFPKLHRSHPTVNIPNDDVINPPLATSTEAVYDQKENMEEETTNYLENLPSLSYSSNIPDEPSTYTYEPLPIERIDSVEDQTANISEITIPQPNYLTNLNINTNSDANTPNPPNDLNTSNATTPNTSSFPAPKENHNVNPQKKSSKSTIGAQLNFPRSSLFQPSTFYSSPPSNPQMSPKPFSAILTTSPLSVLSPTPSAPTSTAPLPIPTSPSASQTVPIPFPSIPTSPLSSSATTPSLIWKTASLPSTPGQTPAFRAPSPRLVLIPQSPSPPTLSRTPPSSRKIASLPPTPPPSWPHSTPTRNVPTAFFDKTGNPLLLGRSPPPVLPTAPSPLTLSTESTVTEPSLRSSVESNTSSDSSGNSGANLYNFTAYNDSLTEYGALGPPPDTNLEDDSTDLYFNTYITEQNSKEYEYRKTLKRTSPAAKSADTMSFELNERFQQLVQTIAGFTEKTSFATKRSTNEHLMHLYQDFVSRATTYGKIIITEVNFPDDKKTIKPVDVGGVAGGEKYIKSGILFKFALDINKIFGNDCNAAKVAGHELKGLISYYNCDVPGLCLPLMLLIDYKGLRLTASTLLPISHGTILYGSHDAGRTIHDKDSVLKDKICQVAKRLNLKDHYCGMDGTSKLMHSPVDLEGHKGTDGRYYLVDFSRTLPPETPNPKYPVSYLYRLLRPEFLQSYNHPLSPDGFSIFSRSQTDFAQNNTELMYATNFLLKCVIPRSAQEMLQAVGELMDSNKDASYFDITQWVHRKGINMRHLGRLSAHLFDIELANKSKSSVQECRLLCIIEMCARCIKQDLRLAMRDEMRKSKELTDWPLRLVVVRATNALFNECDKIWDDLVIRIEQKFDIKLEYMTRDSLADTIKNYSTEFCSDGILFLVKRIFKMLGVKIRKKSIQRWAKRGVYNDGIMVEADLKELSEKIKHMNIIDHAQGYLFRMQSFSSDISEATSYLERAIKRFNSALKSNPTNKYTLRNMAQAYYTLYRVETRKENYELPSIHLHPHLHLADRYYRDCLRADPTDIFSLDQYSSFLVVFHHYKEGIHWLLKQLQVDPNNHSAMVISRHCLHAMGLKIQHQFKSNILDTERIRSSSTPPMQGWKSRPI
eukprot:Phypoly_transcript_00237.p1 GENE.Phypoly_transcript_00237~~Phypoly_transcript_00237.p1  ORF type:complete len:1263 (+),score=191.32 Phypoly_transcript_00237:1964-5752(+)